MRGDVSRRLYLHDGLSEFARVPGARRRVRTGRALLLNAKTRSMLVETARPDVSPSAIEWLGVPLGRAEVRKFSDGEINVELNENVRGQDVFIIQPTCHPTNDNLMELLLMADALHRSSANRITAVVPPRTAVYTPPAIASCGSHCARYAANHCAGGNAARRVLPAKLAEQADAGRVQPVGQRPHVHRAISLSPRN